jgi:Fic-DOC domain mobile mystery protein B
METRLMQVREDSRDPIGSTEVDVEEAAALIPGLLTRDELNAFEQRNIAKAAIWARTSRKLKKSLLSIDSLKLLHKNMFDETWRWAGSFRTTGKNIGVEPHQIQTQLRVLCDDATYWFENKVYPVQECAVRFHHRLVAIHPFPNGNGRHARLAADLLLIYSGEKPFSWGGQSIDVEGQTRDRYLSGLREADKGRYSALLQFATA